MRHYSHLLVSNQERIQEFAKGGGAVLPVPFLSLLLSLSPFSLLRLQLEVGPLKPARGSGEAL